ncbi:MAG: hypothetical protein R3E46_07210 [Sedimenticolaceae bacterium]
MKKKWHLGFFLAALPLLGAEPASASIVINNALLGATGGGTATSCFPFSLAACTNTTVNNAIFAVAPSNTGAGSGAGAFNSFLRVEATGNDTFEQGYNTDARSYNNSGTYNGTGPKTEFDELSNATNTRSVLVGSLEKVTFGAVDYFQLLLDVNEPSATTGVGGISTPLISLHTLELYVGTSPTIDRYSDLTNPATATLIWDLDASPDDRQITLDYNLLGGGSGTYDILALFPYNLLAGFNDTASVTHYFYLYNEFGNADDLKPNDNNLVCLPTVASPQGCTADAGYEEWAYRSQDYSPPSGSSSSSNGGGTTSSEIPVPGTVSLLGVAMLGGLLLWRRRRDPT